MSHPSSANRVLALICIALSLIVIFVWIPLDVETGLIEKVRRRVSLGDAVLPTVAMVFVLVGGLMTAFDRGPVARLSVYNFVFLLFLLLCLAASLAVMRWTGPLVVSIAGAEGDYRALRDTVPWKYTGFALGGITFVASLMALIEGRPSFRGIVVGLLAVIVLIIVYDLPFDDLLLPPNGDV